MLTPAPGKSKAILRPQAGLRHFQLARYLPGADLAPFIERYWIVRWDLPAPYTQENLPYPAINLAFERGRSGVFGIDTGRFRRQLIGRGKVFGVKFKPGGFYPFVARTAAEFTDRCTPIADVFGADCLSLETAIIACDDDAGMVALAGDFLRERLPLVDPTVAHVNTIIDTVDDDPTITRVDALAARFHMSERALQRLFHRYVGVTPKWVIQRYRLHEAAHLLATQTQIDLTELAHTLGYFDQAHFIKAFKNIVGVTPSTYAQSTDDMTTQVD